MFYNISTNNLYICELGKVVGYENNTHILSEERNFIIAKKSSRSHYTYKDVFSRITYKRVEISNNVGDISIIRTIPYVFYQDHVSRKTAFELLNDLNNMNIKRLTKKR